MNIFIGIVLLVISIGLVANVLNSLSGRYGSYNRLWNVILAGSVATIGVFGAFKSFFGNTQLSFGMLLLLIATWSGMFFIGIITGRYSGPELAGVDTGGSKIVTVGALVVSAGAFFGAVRLIT